MRKKKEYNVRTKTTNVVWLKTISWRVNSFSLIWNTWFMKKTNNNLFMAISIKVIPPSASCQDCLCLTDCFLATAAKLLPRTKGLRICQWLCKFFNFHSPPGSDQLAIAGKSYELVFPELPWINIFLELNITVAPSPIDIRKW